MKIIIYGTVYGSSKRYAEILSKKYNMEMKSFNEIKDINIYDEIIYIGSLYAGGVLGMKKTLNKIKDLTNKKIIIATCGVADPLDTENIKVIRNNMKKQLKEEIFNISSIYHIRGAIDYIKLSGKHKFMMNLLYKKCIKIPEEERTPDMRGLIETYDKQVDFISEDFLKELEKEL
ncbi:MAG: hypothetical protein IKP12_03620 [Acholeplasmatales bacterium]|nr:hypothetical protein [Acholeplasmatales bacterium]